MNSFGYQRLNDLIGLIKNSQITLDNAKQVMMRIVDGDVRLPSAIAHELGFIGGVVASEEIQEKVMTIIAQNSNIVDKIIKTGKTGPIMALVGQVMQATNRRGDPVLIKHLINEQIAKQVENARTEETTVE
jgi:Asp-tRNA(Asn)/Glu-tRNA(Gln) amidotransferase B subunit